MWSARGAHEEKPARRVPLSGGEDFVVCGLPAALGIREGGACVGFFARVYPRPLCDWPVRPPDPGQLCARGPVGRAAGHGGLDAAGEIRPGCSEHPGRIPRRLRSRAPRPVPPSPARCWFGPGRPGGPAGGRWGLGLGVRGGGAGLGCWCLVLAVVRLLVWGAGVSVRAVWLWSAWVVGLPGWSVGSGGSVVWSSSVVGSSVVSVSGGVCVAAGFPVARGRCAPREPPAGRKPRPERRLLTTSTDFVGRFFQRRSESCSPHEVEPAGVS
jgi:hypothetical protein